MNSVKKSLSAVIFLACSIAQNAQCEEHPIKKLPFRASLILVKQSTGGSSFSPFISWNPSYTVFPELAVVGDLGITELKTSQGSNFTAIEYQALASYSLTSVWRAEGGFGAQYWSGDGGNAHSPMVSANAIHLINGTGLVREIFGGVSLLFVPNLRSYFFRIGIGT